MGRHRICLWGWARIVPHESTWTIMILPRTSSKNDLAVSLHVLGWHTSLQIYPLLSPSTCVIFEWGISWVGSKAVLELHLKYAVVYCFHRRRMRSYKYWHVCFFISVFYHLYWNHGSLLASVYPLGGGRCCRKWAWRCKKRVVREKFEVQMLLQVCEALPWVTGWLLSAFQPFTCLLLTILLDLIKSWWFFFCREREGFMISTPVNKLEICARFLPFAGPLVAVLPYHDDEHHHALSRSFSPLPIFKQRLQSDNHITVCLVWFCL